MKMSFHIGHYFQGHCDSMGNMSPNGFCSVNLFVSVCLSISLFLCLSPLHPVVHLTMGNREHRPINRDAVKGRTMGELTFDTSFHFTHLSPGEQNSKTSHHVQWLFLLCVINIRAFNRKPKHLLHFSQLKTDLNE